MVDIHACLTALGQQRPLFHSETDFQHALTWHLHTLEPATRVRLECRSFPAKDVYLDLWVEIPARILALELKYLSLPLAVTIEREVYALTSHAGQPKRRCDFVEDVAYQLWSDLQRLALHLVRIVIQNCRTLGFQQRVRGGIMRPHHLMWYNCIILP
jgi:hypothetical protein